MEIRIGWDQILIGTMYAPFCRTKYADMSEWDRDIESMAKMGYQCLHGFTEWWRVEGKKGEFDFSQTDYLIECCAKHGIVPIINVATQNAVGYYMPRWMQEEYRGVGMVDNEGNANAIRSEYQTACLDDPWYQMYAQRYLRAVATHYAGDERVGGWVIWGEPMISRNGKPICYCEHTLARFRRWLEDKYEDIGRLNAVWGNEGPSQYAGFEQVRPPIGQHGQRGSYASWGDFTCFMDDNFAAHIHGADQLLKACGATQPTIAELFCYVGTGAQCNDIWKLSATADIVGVSNFLTPGRESELAMTVANSIAQPHGKSVFVVEALGGPRYPNYDKRTPTVEEVRAEGAQMVGANAKGVMYWCYRPRLSDYEGGTFGMCRADGHPLPRAHAGGDFSRACDRDRARLSAAAWHSDVAVLYSTQMAHLTGADQTSETLGHANQGALRLLLDGHVTPQMINEDWILKGNLSNFKALILPFAYMLNEEVIDAIASFAREGGVVIADQNLGMKRLDATCYTELPGGALRALFGLRREDWVYLEHPYRIERNDWDIEVGNLVDLITLEGAEATDHFGRWPLITRHAYGRGVGHFIGWQAFADYRRRPSRKFREKVLALLADAGVKPFIALFGIDEKDEPPVCASMLRAPDGEVHTLTNPGYEARELTAFIPGARTVEPLLGAEIQGLREADGGMEVCLSLGIWGTATLFAAP